jgi:hypothetical protein
MVNMNKNQHPVRFIWETNAEEVYRNEVGRMASRLSNALKKIESIAQSPVLNFRTVKERIDKSFEIVIQLNPPSMYENVHPYLKEAVMVFKLAADILDSITSKNEGKRIHKAAQLINEGNAFISIVKMRMLRVIAERSEKEEANRD